MPGTEGRRKGVDCTSREPCSSRSSQGTEAQLGALVGILEQVPEMARGHLKTACAKRIFLQFWERVAPRLNRLEGPTKSTKQWMKYWTDKKLIIKKKAAAARRRTGGGVENVRELTKTEERVLQLLGGKGYAVGDRQKRHDIIHHSSERTSATVVSPTSPTILTHVVNSPQDTPAQDANMPCTSAFYGFNSQTPHQTGPLLAPSSPTRKSSPHVCAHLLREPSSQPPSQRSSQMTSLSQSFLRIEERRLALEEKQTQVNLIAAEAQRDMAAAVKYLGEGNHAMAAAIRDGVNIIKDIAENFFST